jgi:aspartyl-tRNA(Asn)/glutamyl-tRNA(Gln) amidotransferase subunit B
MPLLPAERRQRLLDQGLTEHAADVLLAVDAGRDIGLDGELSTRGSALVFFDAVSAGRDAKSASNWYVQQLPRIVPR